MRFQGAIKLPEAPHNIASILSGGSKEFKKPDRFLGISENFRTLKQEIRKSEDGCEGVIEVVRNSTRHLSERAESFLLNDLLLSSFELA
jgi:hypothetical protein